MAFVKSQSNKFKARPVKLKNKFNGDTVEGLLINEEDIEGRKYFVIRSATGAVNKFNKEAFSLSGNTTS